MRKSLYQQSHHSVSPKKQPKVFRENSGMANSFCITAKGGGKGKFSSSSLRKRGTVKKNLDDLGCDDINFPTSIERIINEHDDSKKKILEKYQNPSKQKRCKGAQNQNVTGFQTKNRVNSRHYSAYKNSQGNGNEDSLNNSHTMNFNGSQRSFAVRVKKPKKSNSLRKSPKKARIMDQNERSDFGADCQDSSPNTSFYAKSAGNKSFYMNSDESKLKLIKMEPDKINTDLTLPNINKTTIKKSDSLRKMQSEKIETKIIENEEDPREIETSLSVIKKDLTKNLDTKISKNDADKLSKSHQKSLTKFRSGRKSQSHHRGSPSKFRRLKNPNYKNSQIKLKNYLKSNSKSNLMNLTSSSPATPTEETKAKNIYTIDDFTMVSTITRGSFGIIELVKHTSTHKPFVLKRVPKSSINKEKQVQHLGNEKDILTQKSIKRDFIIECYDTFQTEDDLYFVMEFLPGGDLHDITKKAAFASLEKVKFYFSEVILAIEELHEHRIVYRDLKLDNIMIGADGHVRLIDFGFAKVLKNSSQKTKTQCGTLDYLPPEVIRGVGSDLRSDIWSLGVLLCEMIGGFTPFRASDPQGLYENILHLKINWPRNIDKISKDLISKLLVCEPEMRISLTDIKDHLFFKNIDWESLKAKKVDPPFVPELEDEFSLEHFKDDKKMEMYENPLFEFDQKAGINTKPRGSPEFERQVTGFSTVNNFDFKDF